MYKADAEPAYTQNELFVFNTENLTCTFTVTCEAVHTLLDIPPLQANITVVIFSTEGESSYGMEYYRS